MSHVQIQTTKSLANNWDYSRQTNFEDKANNMQLDKDDT